MMRTHESLSPYRKRENRPISAVQVRLETAGFTYRKWGAMQSCKAGDWVVDNQGDIYTVDQHSFAKTYTEISPGRYVKTAKVWAIRAQSAGVISTKEGETHYGAGDWLVYNDEARNDGYAMSAERFASLYERVEPG